MATIRKQEVITFKVDGSLARVLRRIPNRSEFIRSAVLAALDSACPVCSGTGTLTVSQRHHWDEFAARHPARQCPQCRGVHLVCTARRSRKAARPGPD